MARARKLTVEVLGDVKGLRSSFKQAAAETQTFGQSIEGFAKKALLPATAALTALSAGAVKAVRSAADFDETINKVGVVFGDATDQILKFSEGSAKALGQSQQQALNAASSFALFGKSAGLTGNELVGFSTELVKLATDLASIQNTTVDEAIQAIGSGLRGEAEPLRRFNILLDDFTLRQEAVRLGLIATTKQALTPQQKVLASHAVIMRQGSYAMGDFERTSGGLANQQKILSAELSDVTRQIGERLLPFALRLVEMFRGMVKFVADNSAVFFTLGVVIAGVATAVIAINAAYKVYSAVALATKAINTVLGTSFTALQTSMGIVAGALAAAGFLYTIVKGKKDDYKGATDQLTAALKLEAGAQRQAVAELINTNKNFRDLVKAAQQAGITTEELTYAIENGGSAYDEVTRKIEDLYYVMQDIRGGEMTRLINILKGMRKEVLRTAEGFQLAGNQIRSSAANFRRFEEASWAAMQGATAATTQGVSRIGGGISKLRQNIDNFRNSFSTIRDAARDNLARARQEFDNFAKSVADSLRSGFNFRQAFEDAQARNGSFLGALEEQARKVRDFSVLVNRLVAAGASEAVVQQVLGAGTEAGSAIANEILNTAGGVQTANRLAAEVSSLADTVGQNAASSFRQAGVDTATALVAGIESILRNYQIRLRSRGLTQRQLERLRRNFAADVNFQFVNSGTAVPALAEGGVVARPTLALIGEAGPEAVVPLDRAGEFGMGGGGDTYVTINVQGGDPQAVVNALVRWSRANGSLPSAIRVS
jgi:DNA-binding phage protein